MTNLVLAEDPTLKVLMNQFCTVANNLMLYASYNDFLNGLAARYLTLF